jgi:glycosyltransferase involved in cell wall biosynthesis
MRAALRVGGGGLSEETVVHVIPSYPPSLGGAEKVAQSLVNMRRDVGSTVVLTSRDPKEYSGVAEDGFVRRFRALHLSHTKIIPGLAGALFRVPRGALIHVHITSAFLPEMAYAAHVLRGTRYVAHVHFDIGTSASWAGLVLRRVWMPVVLPRVLRAAAAVAVYTESQRQIIISEYGVDPQRVVTVRNGIDASFFTDDNRALHAKPRVLFVGRLAVEKNVRLLLEALAGTSGRFETTLAGEGPLAGELRQQAASLGLDDLHFHGRADGEDLRNLYRAADIFVLPSKSEGGLSLALLEALAAGLPVVATDLATSREIVVHGENGFLVAPDDPAELAAALLEIVDDADRYERMSRMARKLAEQYRWDAVRDDFERMYDLARATGLRCPQRIASSWRVS